MRKSSALTGVPFIVRITAVINGVRVGVVDVVPILLRWTNAARMTKIALTIKSTNAPIAALKKTECFAFCMVDP